MEWPVQPVYLNAVRPARGRPRLNSEHPNRPVYVQDQNGMLVPAAPTEGYPMGRTMSNQERPASLVIHNNQWDDRPSPGGHHHRRGSHGHDDYYDDYSDYEYDRSPRRRNRSRSHSRHHHYHSPSRSPSPRHHDPVLTERLKKLDDLEKAEEDKARKKAIEEQKKIEEFEKAAREKRERERFKEEEIIAAEKKRKQEEDEKKRKEAWIVQWKLDEDAKKMKEEEKKKKEDEEARERTFKTLLAAGYTEESIEKMLRKADKNDKKGHKEKGKLRYREDDDKQLMRPTYIKVHRKYMSTETLDEFDLPWEIDINTDYIIIKKWINEHDQEELFQHTARLRERKQTKKIEDHATILKKDKAGKLMLVAEKGKGRSRSRSRGWIFT